MREESSLSGLFYWPPRRVLQKYSLSIIGPIAGVGSRLRPFTFNKPKAFLKVAGGMVIDHILQHFQRSFQEKLEITCIVGFKRKQMQQYLLDKYSDQFDFKFITQHPVAYQGDIPLFGGLGEAIYLAAPVVLDKNGKATDDVLIFLADMVLIDSYKAILQSFQRGEVDGVISVMKVPRDQAKHYGIVQTDSDGIITSLVEKPQEYVSDLAIAGIYAFNADATTVLFDSLGKAVRARKKFDKELQFTPAIQDVVDAGFRIQANPIVAGILDFGRPDTLLEGNDFLLKQLGTDVAGSEPNLQNSTLNPPVYVGEDTTIEDSVIGPYVSIGAHCKLGKCVISHSVVGDNTSLDKIITRNAIIGDNVSMEAVAKDQIIIGDKSQLISSAESHSP
jgi:glucose-1-phosphate thymidylyltransferase